MRILDHPLRSVFISVFLIGCIITTAITYILPQVYDENNENFIGTILELIQSHRVLTSVIARLDLTDVWGKRFNNGTPLTENEVLLILKNQMTLTPVANTSLIAITVYSSDKQEAADIANAIAMTFKEFYKNSTSIETSVDSPGQVATKTGVEIVDPAVPGTVPVRPNIPVNLTLGIVFSVILAFGVTALVSLFGSKTGIRIQKSGIAS
jgi:capsular polysaccharide biosynthesis protein